MRKLTGLGIVGVIFLFSYCSPTEKVAEVETELKSKTDQLHEYQKYITEDFLKEHLYEFAGDEMRGRGSGTESIAKAADYIADFNESIGLLPVGDNGSYFQHFDMNARYLDGISFTTLTVSDGDTTIISESRTIKNEAADFYRTFGAENYTFGEIVFAGFGAIDEDRGINNFGESDLSGKWLLVFEDIPYIVDGDTLVDPSYTSRARFNQALFQHNAAGMIIIGDQDQEEFVAEAEIRSKQFGSPVSLGLTDSEPRQRFQSAVLNVSPERAAQILGLDDGFESLLALKSELQNELTQFAPKNMEIHLIADPMMREEVIQEKNIAGVIQGSDPDYKDEYIVLTAHYDHMGIGNPTEDGDVIFNGADDNGSGSVALMNIAKAFTNAREAGLHPKRSILFLHVAVEEWGLLGSRYYSNNPIFPIENTVANINVDMMGRWDNEHEEKGDRDFVYIIGAEIISSDLDSMLHVANGKSSNIRLDMRYNDLTDRNQFYRRSDHWNFGRLRVPFIFFFSGVHEDYHAPGDTPDKILYDSLMKRARVIFSTVTEVGNNPDRPVADNEEFIRITQSEAR